jgi:hypothetical protein
VGIDPLISAEEGGRFAVEATAPKLALFRGRWRNRLSRRESGFEHPEGDLHFRISSRRRDERAILFPKEHGTSPWGPSRTPPIEARAVMAYVGNRAFAELSMLRPLSPGGIGKLHANFISIRESDRRVLHFAITFPPRDD